MRDRLERDHRYTLGDLELISLFDGFLRLDGGAMFGVVPKAAVGEADAARRRRTASCWRCVRSSCAACGRC